MARKQTKRKHERDMHIRLEPDDYEIVEQAAEAARLTVTAWCRTRLVILAAEELDPKK